MADKTKIFGPDGKAYDGIYIPVRESHEVWNEYILEDGTVLRMFCVLRPIPVHLVRADEGSIASFWDANIHSSGENVAEALAGIKTLIADAYQMLTEHRDALGPEPSKQFVVLREYIQPA